MCNPFIDKKCEPKHLIKNGCELWDVACNAQFAIDSAMRDMATQVTEAVRKALASVGTMWLDTPRIDVVAGGGDSGSPGVHAGEHAPLIDGVNPINEVLGWVMWIALGMLLLGAGGGLGGVLFCLGVFGCFSGFVGLVGRSLL